MNHKAACCLLVAILAFSLLSQFFIVEPFQVDLAKVNIQPRKKSPKEPMPVSELSSSTDIADVEPAPESPAIKAGGNLLKPGQIHKLVNEKITTALSSQKFENQMRNQHYQFHQEMKDRKDKNTV